MLTKRCGPLALIATTLLAAVCSPATAQLVINEIDYDSAGNLDPEFIEIASGYFASAPPCLIDLSEYRLELWDGATNSPYLILPLAGSLRPYQYHLVCGPSNPFQECDQVLPGTTNIIQNGAPDGVLIRHISSGTVVDALSYEGSIPGLVEGSPATAFDDPSHWWQSMSRNSDTNDAATDWVASFLTPGYSNAPPPGCASADFNQDGDTGTDLDIEDFFACIGGNCCCLCGSADFNGDGDTGTDLDIEAFFRVLAGSC